MSNTATIPTVHIPTVWSPSNVKSNDGWTTYRWQSNDIDTLVDTLKEWSDYLFDYTQVQTGFPLSNVYSKVWSVRDSSSHDDPSTTIVFALAGFSKKDVRVKHDKAKHKLIIEGTCSNKNLKDATEGHDNMASTLTRHWVHRGIKGKDFSRTFTMHEHAVIDECTMKDGLLTIVIKKDVPEEEKPVSIEVK